MKCPKCNTDNPVDSKFCKECATPLPTSEEPKVVVTKTMETAVEELATGSTFADRYQIIEELGKGGMGRVYKVQDTEIREKVALKLLKPEIASDEKTIERFRNEIKLARKVGHKNVGRMYDLGRAEGSYFITMEFVEGQDLKGLIRQSGQLAVGTTINIAKQICEGLAEAHRLGVVHRDLKPSNIMIDKDGSARIMDFGIARSLKGKGITGAGVIIGTPEYMSPEQVEGKELDQRSDLYSLGIILYEMVTGRPPFEGDTPLSIAVKHKTEAPPDPKDLNAQIPEDLSRLIHKCLEKNKETRYQSAGELRSELDRIEKGIPSTEREIPKRKPLTSREITVTFGLKKLFIPALVAMAVIVTGIILWHPWSRGKPAPISLDKPALAILYFENVSGNENLEGWRTGLTELLITDLMQSKFINVLPRDRVFGILKKLNLQEAKTYTTEDLVKVADEGRASHTISGSYMKAGEDILITLILQKPHTGEVVNSIKVQCRGEEEILPKVDELTMQLKRDLNITQKQIASDIDKTLEKITTSSPEAFKYYVEGVESFRRGEFQESIQFLEKAISIDSQFAMAYRMLGSNYHSLGYIQKRKEYIKQAFELADRLPDRERYQIQGDYYFLTIKNYDKAIEAYSKLLELYPDDIVGNNNLGRLYWLIGEEEKAIERFEVNIRNKDFTAISSYSNAAQNYAAQGMYDRAEEILESYLNNISDNHLIRWRLALTYLCQGKFDLSLKETDRGLSLNPKFFRLFRLKGGIFQCLGEFAQAEQEYRKLLELKDPSAYLEGRTHLGVFYISQGRYEEAKNQARQGIELAESIGEKERKLSFHRWLAYMHFSSGHFNRTLGECDIAMSIAREVESLLGQIISLHLKGLALTRMKRIQDAESAASELKDLIEIGMNRKAIRFYYDLMGRIELERGEFSKAINNFRKAIPLLGYQRGVQRDAWDQHAQFIEPLAIAYYRSGDLVKAEEQYKRITSLTTGRMAYGDIYAKSFYMLGKIYEQQGWEGKAIESYEKFLDLWKDADPGIEEVEDAKERMANLKNI